ncbi:MAG: recombinase family protein, partial [Firmicutes bacterium]|nr:recombinase family protein [Bacillota bacterium]
GDGELLLTILASYAQAESLAVSENCTWRIRRQFAEGKPTSCKVFGYTRDYEIIPEETAVIRQLFADYLGGMGVLAIQKKLIAQGVRFSVTALRDMLRSEKYAGDLLLQKTYTTDHLSKRRVKNTGQLPMYLVENNHEAIIDRAAFEAVQAEYARRSAQHHAALAPKEGYAFTGLIRCGICGAPFGHKIAGSAPKYKKSVWICNTFNTLGKAHCPSQMIPEDILQAKLDEAGGMEGLHEIIVPGSFLLSFIYKDGRRVDLTWQHPSRRDSWTPEMKQAAREKSTRRVLE